MATFGKVRTKGIFQGQEIVNLLYYAIDGQPNFPFDVAQMTDLAETVALEVLTQSNNVLPSTFAWTEVGVTIVDERGVTVSPFEVVEQVNLPGSLVEDTDGQAQVAIVSFQVVPRLGTPAGVPPKRTYIALGPLVSASVNAQGQLTWNSTLKAQVAGYYSTPIEGNLANYVPVRVGRQPSPALPTYGDVVGAVVRPYSSFRRSRLVRPSGQI